MKTKRLLGILTLVFTLTLFTNTVHATYIMCLDIDAAGEYVRTGGLLTDTDLDNMLSPGNSWNEYLTINYKIKGELPPLDQEYNWSLGSIDFKSNLTLNGRDFSKDKIFPETFPISDYLGTFSKEGFLDKLSTYKISSLNDIKNAIVGIINVKDNPSLVPLTTNIYAGYYIDNDPSGPGDGNYLFDCAITLASNVPLLDIFLGVPSDKLQALGLLSWDAINTANFGIDSTIFLHADPIPEPTTIVLMACGLLGLLAQLCSKNSNRCMRD